MPISQTGSYIPTTDAGIRDFFNNFAAIVAQDPAAVGLTQADSDVLSGFALQYDAAYQVAISPATRTPNAVSDKDTIRNQARDTFRIFALQIKQNEGVDENLKISLGIHINDTTPTPIPAPVTSPLLAIVGAESGSHTLRYADSATPTSRAKAPGATQLWLYSYVGAMPTTDSGLTTFVGAYTKQPFVVEYQPEQANLTASYFARWATARGLVGPWSLPVAMQIAFGGPVEQQFVTGGTPQQAGGEDLKIAA